MKLHTLFEKVMEIVNHYKLGFVFLLLGAGLFFLASSVKNEISCSGRWSPRGCDGLIASYWEINPILLTIGGLSLFAAILLYCSKNGGME